MDSLYIGDALFSGTRQRVLGLLFSKPDKRFYTNEILRWAGMGRGTVMRELERLTQAGILQMSREGNLCYYQANQASPVFPELLGLVRKTFGIADVIRAALMPVEDDVRFAFVYGSLAKSSDTASSDIDLMLVSDSLAYADVMDVLHPVEKTLTRPVHPTLYSTNEFRNKLSSGSSFVQRVLEQPKLWVKGSDDDIAGAGKPGKNRRA